MSAPPGSPAPRSRPPAPRRTARRSRAARPSPARRDSFDLANLDVAQGQVTPVIALDRDVAAHRPAVVRPVLELAFLHLRLPLRTQRLILDDLRSMEPVLDVG